MNMKGISGYVVNQLKAGRYTFNKDEAEKALGTHGRALYMALRRMQLKGWLAAPLDGFYVIIDPQHQGFGTIPPEWIIDDLAHYEKVDYYVSTLSAAMLHGASHQKPQRFHVVASHQMRKIERDGYRMDFFYREHIHPTAWQKMKCPAGYFHVSTPEMTVYDLMAFNAACPSLDLAATVYTEIGAKLQPDRLAELADTGCRMPALQRAGWLLDASGWQEKTGRLAERLTAMSSQWQSLRPDRARKGNKNQKWRIIENAKVEPDIQKS